MIRSTATVTLALTVVFTAGGCTSALQFVKRPHVEPVRAVSEILTIWQPGEGRDADGLPARGFAGRLFFFAPGEPTPAAVEGTVTVYLFDDAGSPEEQARPLHKFVFEPDAWDTHRAESDIGTAYQIFLPYPRAGSHRANCSLRVRFEAEGRQPTLSEAANVVLHGSRTDAPVASTASASTRDSAVQTAGFTAGFTATEFSSRPAEPSPGDPATQKSPGVRVHTIPMTRRPEISRR